MKKFLVIFSIIVVPVVAFIGMNIPKHSPTSCVTKDSFAMQENLETITPIQKDQNFVILILAETVADTYERQLQSIFEQNYESYHVHFLDRGSSDHTAEIVKSCSEKAGKESMISYQHYGEEKPAMELIYEIIHSLDPHDVVVLLQGADWLAHENTLDHLNCAYAHPDVWLTHSRGIHHPDYQKIEGGPYSDHFRIEKKFREEGDLPLSSLISFYAGFFAEIHLEDLLYEGTFIDERSELAYLYPLFEMGQDHILFIDEVMLIKNDSAKRVAHKEHLYHLMAVESYIHSQKQYPALHSLRLNRTPASMHRQKGDVLIFSEDSPLHLYACLESLHLKVRDINDIYVIYQSQDSEFGRAYLNLKKEFPAVNFLDVCDYPGCDFETLVSEAVMNKRHRSPYLLITDDQEVFDDKLRLHECIEKMEKVHANYFFLTALDDNADRKTISIDVGVNAWQLGEEAREQSPYMCLCRKAPLREALAAQEVPNLEAFQMLWKRQLPPRAIALFYDEDHAIPIKFEKEIAFSQKKEWGRKFIEGYKIDLPSLLYEIDELKEGEYPLIKREKR